MLNHRKNVVSPISAQTPIGAAVRGISAGMAATFLLAAGSRVAAAAREQFSRAEETSEGVVPAAPPPAASGSGAAEAADGDGASAGDPTAPQADAHKQGAQHGGERQAINPTNPNHLRRAQAERYAQAERHPRGKGPAPSGDGMTGENGGQAQAVITPAGALVKRQTAGTEDLAEEVAYKVAAGVFDRDISPYLPVARFAVHMGWGATGGLLYGLLQGSYDWPTLRSGVLFGLGFWLVGPASLAPAMKLTGPVREEPPSHTAMLVAGHAAYGAVLAWAFALLRPRWQRHPRRHA